MEKLLVWFAENGVASFFRTFALTVASMAILDWTKLGYFDFTNWQVWVIAGLVSVFGPLSRKANPYDSL